MNGFIRSRLRTSRLPVEAGAEQRTSIHSWRFSLMNFRPACPGATPSKIVRQRSAGNRTGVRQECVRSAFTLLETILALSPRAIPGLGHFSHDQDAYCYVPTSPASIASHQPAAAACSQPSAPGAACYICLGTPLAQQSPAWATPYERSPHPHLSFAFAAPSPFPSPPPELRPQPPFPQPPNDPPSHARGGTTFPPTWEGLLAMSGPEIAAAAASAATQTQGGCSPANVLSPAPLTAARSNAAAFAACTSADEVLQAFCALARPGSTPVDEATARAACVALSRTSRFAPSGSKAGSGAIGYDSRFGLLLENVERLLPSMSANAQSICIWALGKLHSRGRLRQARERPGGRIRL